MIVCGNESSERSWSTQKGVKQPMWSDKETTSDCLGFETYVESLSAVCLEPEIAPLTLGIFGSWGSGKTSLMKMLQAAVNVQEKVKTVWANAWRYEGKDEMQSALIHAILAQLKEEKTLVGEAKEILDRLKKGASILKLGKFIGKTLLTMTPDIGGLVDCFTEESEKLSQTMAQFEQDFDALLQRVDVDRIVVFIDDLDRCQSEKVIEIFETIKLFLNIPKCTFVIGADATKIEQAIKDFYKFDQRVIEPDHAGGRTFSEDYLEKIIQLPFRIPEQRLTDIAYYVGMLSLQMVLTADAWQALAKDRIVIIGDKGGVHEGFAKWIRERNNGDFKRERSLALQILQRTQPYIAILARGLRGNPRQIKRFLNILELRQRLAHANKLDISEDILIKVLVLEYTWKWFFQEVADDCDAETGKSDLLAELVLLYNEGKKDDPNSQMLTKALTTPGLPEFLIEQPVLHNSDLRPFLFLAQTALNAKPEVLTPPDVAALELVLRIGDADRIRSKSAAREAARADGVMAAAVVRALASKVHIESNAAIQVNLVNGLSLLCERHPTLLSMAIEGIGDLDLSKNEALALAVSPIVDHAKAAGLDVAALSKKIQERSKLVKILSGGSKKRPTT